MPRWVIRAITMLAWHMMPTLALRSFYWEKRTKKTTLQEPVHYATDSISGPITIQYNTILTEFHYKRQHFKEQLASFEFQMPTPILIP